MVNDHRVIAGWPGVSKGADTMAQNGMGNNGALSRAEPGDATLIPLDPAARGPGVVKSMMSRRAPIECGDLPFLIRRDGTWLYRGSPIGRKSLVCLFASVLKRDEEGRFLLETPAERGSIEVEDAPFVAVGLDWHGEGRSQVLHFRTNIDQMITAGPAHPLRVAHDLLTCEPTPYVHVRDGAGGFPIEARIGRAVYYELIALAEPGFRYGKRVLGVWSQGIFFSLGEIASCAG